MMNPTGKAPGEDFFGMDRGLNDIELLTNPAYRRVYPDQDRASVTLNKGWNKLLVKVLQKGDGWGYHGRFVNPEGR